MVWSARDLAGFFGKPFGIDADYRVQGNDPPQAVRLLPERGDEIDAVGGASVVSARSLFLVQVSDVAAPASGDTLEDKATGAVYKVQGDPTKPAAWRGNVWRLDAPEQ